MAGREGTMKAVRKPTLMPRVLLVAIMAVAVARSPTGNQSADKTGGANVSTVPATPLNTIEIIETTSARHTSFMPSIPREGLCGEVGGAG